MSATTHPYATIEAALQVVAKEARGVPSSADPDVCRYCFRAKDPSYAQCFGCRKLMLAGVSTSLLARVVPLSTALDPGPWYSRMSSYKLGTPDNMYLVAAAAYAALTGFREQFRTMLGGEPDVACVVPSSKQDVAPKEHRLYRSLRLIHAAAGLPVEPLLTHVAGETRTRNDINPKMFTGDKAAVAGKRVILFEDTWVTGGTAISAAKVLQELGVLSLAIVPIARRVESKSVSGFTWGAPYVARVEALPWNPDALVWPRP